jgi:hypothetical protein
VATCGRGDDGGGDTHDNNLKSWRYPWWRPTDEASPADAGATWAWGGDSILRRTHIFFLGCIIGSNGLIRIQYLASKRTIFGSYWTFLQAGNFRLVSSENLSSKQGQNSTKILLHIAADWSEQYRSDTTWNTHQHSAKADRSEKYCNLYSHGYTNRMKFTWTCYSKWRKKKSQFIQMYWPVLFNANIKKHTRFDYSSLATVERRKSTNNHKHLQ